MPPDPTTTIDETEVLELLTSLVNKSLVAYSSASTGHGRYRLSETVHEYARDRLKESGESEEFRTAHRDHFLVLAEEAEPQLQGPEEEVWLKRLEAERDNLRASLELRNDTATLRLAGALFRFWHIRGYLSEGREWLATVLVGDLTHACIEARAKALNGAGALAHHQGDDDAVCALGEESLAIFRESGDKGGIASSLNNLGDVAFAQGDFPAARALYEESLTLFRELGNKGGIAYSLGNLGSVAQEKGDYVAARTLYAESLALYREVADKRGMASSLGNLGAVAHDQHDYAAARTLNEESLVLRRELGNRRGIACLIEAFAALSLVQKLAERATQLWGAADELRKDIGTPLMPSERRRYGERVARALADLGADAFALAWSKGRAMTLDQAIDYALQVPDNA